MTRVALGLGLTGDATTDDVRAAADAALVLLGLGWDDVATLATTVRRRNHPAMRELAATGLALALFEPSDLAGVTVPNPSAAVGERAGTPSVAEAAALLAAGTDVLLLPKQVGNGVTLAVAEIAERP